MASVTIWKVWENVGSAFFVKFITIFEKIPPLKFWKFVIRIVRKKLLNMCIRYILNLPRHEHIAPHRKTTCRINNIQYFE